MKQKRKISRQRLWQIEQRAKGNCGICGKPREGASTMYCLEHLIKQREYIRKRGKAKRRNRNAKSYKLKVEQTKKEMDIG